MLVLTSCSQDSKDSKSVISDKLDSNLVNPNDISSRAGEILTAKLPNIILKGTNVVFTGTASNTITEIKLNVDGFDLGNPVPNSTTGTWTKTHNFSLGKANRILKIDHNKV